MPKNGARGNIHYILAPCGPLIVFFLPLLSSPFPSLLPPTPPSTCTSSKVSPELLGRPLQRAGDLLLEGLKCVLVDAFILLFSFSFHFWFFCLPRSPRGPSRHSELTRRVKAKLDPLGRRPPPPRQGAISLSQLPPGALTVKSRPKGRQSTFSSLLPFPVPLKSPPKRHVQETGLIFLAHGFLLFQPNSWPS